MVESMFRQQLFLNSTAFMEEYHLSLGSSVTYRLQQHYAGLKMYAHTTEIVGSRKAVPRELDTVQKSSTPRYHLFTSFQIR